MAAQAVKSELLQRLAREQGCGVLMVTSPFF